MAFEEIKKKGVMDMSGMEGEMGLVAGRSQREKRRSYKDLLREEEEIAAEESDLFSMGGDAHKKKKKHSDDHYRDHHSSGPPPHKKKRKSSDRSPSLSSSSSSQPPNCADTAMGLLQAITSPMATGSDPNPHLHKKPAYPPHASHTSSKDRKREGGSKSSHSSFSHSQPPGLSSSSSKKHSSASSSSSSKSSLFHGGTGRGEPLTLREAEGLKMKLILSPKEREGGGLNKGIPFPPQSSSSTETSGHHLSSGVKKAGTKKEKERDRMTSTKLPKKKQHSREPLPVIGKEVEVEGHYGGSIVGLGGDSSSSGGELEAGELVIDDSYTHLSKKKKKSKKSKKKKDKEKHRDKDKSSKEKKHSKGGSGGKKGFPGDPSRGHTHSHSSSNHSTSGMYAMAPPIHSHHHQTTDHVTEKKKKKEEKDKDKNDKEKPKKKSMTAYQVFSKEYRLNINSEQPGLVFGELSKRLAEVWKQLPEKEKQVWKQKAQYLQHKQNKAEATTIKQKTSLLDSKSKISNKSVGLGSSLTSAGRSSLGMALSPVRVPEVDPIDAAAHLQLLGESLSLIGHRLQETEGMVAVSGSLSVLLDSILCALGPLTCLTAQVPQLNGCPRSVLSNTLDNIAYIMPGL
ncbi:HMG domain-containing protein 4a isoform X2 [Hoplias malabaricus]|uniref:HMG domain-containing protein 4a isoform X2 n=1 Tax=Hoplias malabaricus TaxID=27720 RepID=UPI0034634D79